MEPQSTKTSIDQEPTKAPPQSSVSNTISSVKYTKQQLMVVIIPVLVLIIGFSMWSYSKEQKRQNDLASVNTPNLYIEAQNKTSNLNKVTTTPTKVDIPTVLITMNQTKIPLGDGNYGNTARNNFIYACQTSYSTGAGGAQVAGPWINTTAKTWDKTKKVAVSGAVKWPTSSFFITNNGQSRNITANDLPINGQTTGTFPVSSTDNAYKYDRNPNKIAAQNVTLNLPLTPTIATSPTCLNGGAIGILMDGVVLFNGLDGEGRDAAAYETLDSCDGHPERTSEYHHHDIPSCILNKYNVPSSSTLIGYANDGFGIYIERDKYGALPTNNYLDKCHGRTSYIEWDGKLVNMYHYEATIEYPYTLGCFMGSNTVKQSQAGPNGTTQNGTGGVPPKGSQLPPPKQ